MQESRCGPPLPSLQLDSMPARCQGSVVGLDPVGFRTCQLADAYRGGLGRVLTLGRQTTFLSDSFFRRAEIPPHLATATFCEPLLKDLLGATQCDSVDYSDYEEATYIHDLNLPLPTPLRGAYDTVLDLGTLEHVFDVRASFENVGTALRPGGWVAHVLPANQQCGHGLYQFSPEMLYSYYSHANGYDRVSAYLVLVTDPDTWYEVPRPNGAHRVNVTSSTGLYVVLLAQKHNDASPSVLQSDYVDDWVSTGSSHTASGNRNSSKSERGGGAHLTSLLARSPRMRSIKRTSDRLKTAWSSLRQPLQCNVDLNQMPFETLLGAARNDAERARTST